MEPNHYNASEKYSCQTIFVRLQEHWRIWELLIYSSGISKSLARVLAYEENFLNDLWSYNEV